MVNKLSLIVCLIAIVMNGFGQDVQFESVNKLPSSINSACEEILPMISPDGKSLYFLRVNCDVNLGGKTAGSDIWVSEFNTTTNEWGRPKNSGNVFNDKGHNALVGISTDGKTIYQINTSAGRKIRGVYFSRLADGKWSPPILEPIAFLETEEYFGMYVSPDMKTIIASMKREDGSGEEDLYVSRKNGQKWTEPVNLGTSINSIGYEISPFLSADTKRLYFASNGHRGLGGSDIFYSDRLDESWTLWSAPVNLGSVINTEGFDAYFTIADGVAWFSSSNGISSDIYKANIRKPQDPRKLAVSSIVAEASSMLADLNDDTYDSLSNYTQSVFVSFERNTAALSKDALAQLNEAVSTIIRRREGRLTLVAYANNGGESGQLWDKRMEEIRNYLRSKSGVDLMIDHEIIRIDVNESARKGSVVEVRYN
jgi:WD40-like Beta Propeller Repeat